MRSCYQIIFLNGASSSGKTILARSLQEGLEYPFLHIGADTMIQMMPEKMNNWVGGKAPLGISLQLIKDGSNKPRRVMQVGPFARGVFRSFEKVVLTLAEQGHALIVDDVAYGKEAIDAWRESLKGYRVLWVGLRVPLEELENREKARGDRMVGTARDQFFKVHEGVNYDLEIDSTKESIEKSVSKIVRLVQGSEQTDADLLRQPIRLQAQ